MKVSFEASFARGLKGIKDKALLRRVEQVIAGVKTATALSEIKHLSKMRGYATTLPRSSVRSTGYTASRESHPAQDTAQRQPKQFGDRGHAAPHHRRWLDRQDEQVGEQGLDFSLHRNTKAPPGQGRRFLLIPSFTF